MCANCTSMAKIMGFVALNLDHLKNTCIINALILYVETHPLYHTFIAHMFLYTIRRYLLYAIAH